MNKLFAAALVLLTLGALAFGLYFNPSVIAGIKEFFGDDPDMPAILNRAKSGFTKEEFMKMRAGHIAKLRGIDKDNPPDPQDRIRAIREMQVQEDILAQSLVPQSAWTELGPNPIPNAQVETAPVTTASGRVISIAVNPTNANIVYVGTAQGGLYRSTNGGTNWTRMMDNALSLAIGAIAIAPSQPDTVYVGTGEPNFSVDSFFGVGVYRIDNASTASPTLSGPFNQNTAAVDVMTGAAVSGIAVHPTDPNTIFVSTTFGLGGIGGIFPTTLPALGLYRSTNAAGASPTFTKLTLFAGNSNLLNVSDVVIDPSDPNTVICVTGDAFGVASSAQRGIYRSTNALAVAPTFTLEQNLNTFDRSELAIARVAGVTTVYAASGLGAGQVWRSTNAGDTFAMTIDNNFCTPQCFYDVAIDVDPTNAANVYLGGSPSLVFGRSADSGATFTADGVNFTAGLHVDTHAIAVAPSSPTTVYFGSDGGIYKTTNVSATPIVWTSLNNSQFTATQFMGLAVHSTDVNFTIGGTQDNGTNHYRADQTWNRVDFGDGGYAVIDQADTSTSTLDMYHTYFNGSTLTGYAYVGSTAGASDGMWSFRGCQGATANGISCTGTILFYAPLEQGPGSPNNTIYYGADRLYRSTDRGVNHTTVSQTFTAAISAIGIASQNDNVRVLGLESGEIFGTTTGANPLVDMDPLNTIPNGFVARAVIDPNNVNTAYVTLNSYGANNVWKTTTLNSFADGIAPTWTSASSGLPSVPVNAFVVDPLDSNRLYAGTDIGVYTSTNGGTSWVPYGTGLPRVAVFDMAISGGTALTRRLRIATHGRGLWENFAVAPSAAGVTVSGRVISPVGSGVGKAVVTITDNSGGTRSVMANQFGRYSFDDIISGQSYVLHATAKGYSFDPRVVQVEDEILDANITATGFSLVNNSDNNMGKEAVKEQKRP
jgi:photosystem II stability/assembly factor-like uncharacterized protein